MINYPSGVVSTPRGGGNIYKWWCQQCGFVFVQRTRWSRRLNTSTTRTALTASSTWSESMNTADTRGALVRYAERPQASKTLDIACLLCLPSPQWWKRPCRPSVRWERPSTRSPGARWTPPRPTSSSGRPAWRWNAAQAAATPVTWDARRLACSTAPSRWKRNMSPFLWKDRWKCVSALQTQQ